MVLMIRMMLMMISVCFQGGDGSSEVGIGMLDAKMLQQRGRCDANAKDGKDGDGEDTDGGGGEEDDGSSGETKRNLKVSPKAQ